VDGIANSRDKQNLVRRIRLFADIELVRHSFNWSIGCSVQVR
jgi:hypothetical protein